MKNLYMDYYYDKNNKFDEFIDLLDCVQTPLYFILKQKVEGIDKPYEAFLQDTTFELFHNLDGTSVDMDLSCYQPNPDIFDIRIIQGEGMETLGEIKGLLDQDEIVIFNTFLPRVPSYAYYISKDYPFNASGDRNGHVLVALGLKEDTFYYLESPWMLHKENFISFNGSTTVGMIPVSELQAAFDCFLNYYVVKIKNQGLAGEVQKRNLIHTIGEITANFTKASCVSQEKKFYYNNEALSTLNEFLKEGIIHLGDKQEYYNMPYCSLLAWKTEIIRKKKVVLIECMKKFPFTNNPDDIEVLQKNSNQWQFIVSILNMKSHKNQLENCDEIIKYFNKLKESEERVFCTLSELQHRLQSGECLAGFE